MTSVTFTAKIPNIERGLRREVQRLEREQHRAGVSATHLASKRGQRRTQAKMRSVGLKKLSNAVGQASSQTKRRRNLQDNPFGVIFARGGDESRGGQALQAYTQGAIIRPRNGSWLAVPTDAAQKLVSVGGRRRRLTPKLWAQAGMNQRVGKLRFRQVRGNLAMLFVENVSLSPKTGRAKVLPKSGRTRTRVVPKRPVVIFWLIKVTRRAKRFDQRTIMQGEANRVPTYMLRILRGYRTS